MKTFVRKYRALLLPVVSEMYDDMADECTAGGNNEFRYIKR